VREEAEAVAARCGADLRVSALAADTPAAQRDALLHAGQLVVATPGQVAQARPEMALGVRGAAPACALPRLGAPSACCCCLPRRAAPARLHL